VTKHLKNKMKKQILSGIFSGILMLTGCGETPEQITSIPSSSDNSKYADQCTDSDGYLNREDSFYVPGQTTYTYKDPAGYFQITNTKFDRCTPEGSLKEFVCDGYNGKNPVYVEYRCPDGCFFDRCNEQ